MGIIICMRKFSMPDFRQKVKDHLLLYARNIEAADLLDNFLIASVSSIVLTRIFLNLTGFPQLGGAGLHIGHMLWGGLLMLVGTLLLMVFLNKEAKRLAVIISGIGFGLFIDEIGKFVTSNNDYFFQPAFALIYIIFILIFYFIRRVVLSTKWSDKEYAVNALEEMKEVVYYDLDEHERQRVIDYLDSSDPQNPVVPALKQTILTISPHTTDRDISPFSLLKNTFRSRYFQQIQNERISRFIAGGYIFMSIVRFFVAVTGIEFELDFWEVGRQLSSAVVFVLVLLGLNYQRRRRLLEAHYWYLRAALVSILIVQIFDFYFDQLTALLYLIAGLLSYTTLQYLLKQEKERTPAPVEREQTGI